jgi:hypothetical protein
MPAIKQAQDKGELWSLIRTPSGDAVTHSGKNAGEVEEDESISAYNDCSHKKPEETNGIS